MCVVSFNFGFTDVGRHQVYFIALKIYNFKLKQYETCKICFHEFVPNALLATGACTNF